MNSELVKEFNKIRDIPYSIPQNNCSRKCIKLKNVLEKYWYISRYRVCEFNWMDFNFPPEIKKLIKQNNSLHVFLEVLVEGNIIILDPTWDYKLRNIFEINIWDGKSNTKIAVKTNNIYDYNKSENIILWKIKILEDSGNQSFYKLLNIWFEKIEFNK
mgnify:CR=1 FL=1